MDFQFKKMSDATTLRNLTKTNYGANVAAFMEKVYAKATDAANRGQYSVALRGPDYMNFRDHLEQELVSKGFDLKLGKSSCEISWKTVV